MNRGVSEMQDRAKKAIAGLIAMHRELLVTLEARGTPFLPEHNYEAWSNTALDAMTILGDLTAAALAAEPGAAEGMVLVHRADLQFCIDAICHLKEHKARIRLEQLIAAAPHQSGESGNG